MIVFRTAVFVLLIAVAVGSGAPARPLQPAVAASPAAVRFAIVPAESSVTYRVSEVFLNENNRFNVAVGVTSAIKGDIVIDRANPRQSRIGTITVEISQFKSDSTRRDNAIRRWWLESSRFPTAEFTPIRIEGLPDSYTDGQDLDVRIVGNLKVRNVVRPNTAFDAKIKLQGATLTGQAETMVLMTEFGFDPPSILGVLRADNEVRIEFKFVARPPSAP